MLRLNSLSPVEENGAQTSRYEVRIYSHPNMKHGEGSEKEAYNTERQTGVKRQAKNAMNLAYEVKDGDFEGSITMHYVYALK